MALLTNSNLQILLWFASIVHLYLCFRYALKAVLGHVENYSFAKMALVVFVPFLGYYLALKEDVPVT